MAYAVVANEIVHGGLPYLNAIDRKPPLLFTSTPQSSDAGE
jgi:hypothetical protein